MNVGPTDWIVLVVAIALWVAIIWRGTQVRVLSALWWSCVFLAAYVTFKTNIVNGPLNAATGGLHLDALARNLAAVGAVLTTLHWQSWIRHGEGGTGRRVRIGAGVLMSGWLIGWWFASPIYNMPFTPWIPRAVDSAPPMILHYLGLHVFLLICSVIFIRSAALELRALRGGSATYIRVSLGLFIAAFTINVVVNGIHGTLRATALVTGSPMAWQWYAPLDLVLIAVYVLILLGIVIPLTRPGRWRRATVSGAEVESLWNWLRERTDGDSGGGALRTDTLLGQVTAIRDRLHRLQRWVSPDSLSKAGRQARLAGLTGTPGAAYTAALCLQMAADAERRGDPIVDPPPALLGQLGGGRTAAGESKWFAQVWTCLVGLSQSQAGRAAST